MLSYVTGHGLSKKFEIITLMTKMKLEPKLTEEVKKQNLTCIRLYTITSEMYFESVLSAPFRGTL